jgi:dienelactone hydrolase
MYMPAGAGPLPVVLAVEPVWQDHLLPVAKLVAKAGYIFAGYERHDLDPDNADRSDGLHPLYPDYDWASLAVWAWGASRVVDYIEQTEAADATRIVLTGHSRAGKVALLAGALDTRIALTVPHGSGAGGAGSFRIVGQGAESLAAITEPDRFHYWFHPKLAEFAGNEELLPFDQHFLRALIAPRAVASIDGLDDRWANPDGTRAMCVAAQPVFAMLGAPRSNMACFRPGGHDMTLQDWDILLAVADNVLFQKPLHPSR